MSAQTVCFLLAARGAAASLAGVLECRGERLRLGDNGLYLRGGDLRPQAVWCDGARHALAPHAAAAFEWRHFSAAQRLASRAFCDALLSRHPALAPALDAGAGWPPRLTPALVAVHADAATRLYHFVQQGEPGGLFLRCGDGPCGNAPPADWATFEAMLAGQQGRLAALRPALGDECWYTKWRPDLELERKFTFEGIPDTWRLLLRCHAAIAAGELADFVPELDREIQVWDYEQHIVEVLGPDAERGYIAFIPQADGRMTVKRKWFAENSELRREALQGDLALGLDGIEAHVRSLTSAPTRRLPAYRRKRFDAQFESLASGNVFGLYMDVCRTLDGAHAFSQCEVEYCRTRSFGEIRRLQQDFHDFSAWVGAALTRWGVAHRQDLTSKLDFVRSAAGAAPVPREPQEQT